MMNHLSNEMVGISRYLGKEYKDKEKIRVIYTEKLDYFLYLKDGK